MPRMVSVTDHLQGCHWWCIRLVCFYFLLFMHISAQEDLQWESRDAKWNQQPNYIYSPQPVAPQGSYVTTQPLQIQQQPQQISTGAYELRSFCRAARGQFPSGNGCHKFVNCWDGEVTEQDCPAGLLFTSRGYCDYAWNVQCEGRAMPSPAEISGAAPGWNPFQEPAVCPDGEGILTRAANDCGAFIVCHHGVYDRIACPPGLHFNQELKVCDFPDNVRCGYTSGYIPSSTPTASPTLPPPPPPRPIASEYHPPENNYVSSPQYPSVPQNPYSQTHHVTRLPAGLVSGAASLSCREGATYPLTVGTCQHVTLCRQGRATLVHCPEGQGFDAYSARCILDENARC